MMRIHDDTVVVTRSNISLAIAVAAFVFGVWELWHAATVSGATDGYFFGITFLAAAAFALRMTLTETRDLVIAFDADKESGQAAISLWRPFRNKRIETRIEHITGWRHWIQTKSRGRRAYFLLAEEPSHESTLRFELRPGSAITKELREIAPGAIADFEREAGIQSDP